MLQKTFKEIILEFLQSFTDALVNKIKSAEVEVNVKTRSVE